MLVVRAYMSHITPKHHPKPEIRLLPVLGTWTVPPFTNSAPSAVSVSPVSGTGAVQTLTFTFSDPNGFADLSYR